MTWYLYNDKGENIAVISAPDIESALKEARKAGYINFSIERA